MEFQNHYQLLELLIGVGNLLKLFIGIYCKYRRYFGSCKYTHNLFSQTSYRKMPPCACCGNKEKNKPTCGKRIHPCVRREKERTFTVLQKFDIICDGDIELCELTRDAYENEVRD
jgi:hypothetical protein